MADEASSDQHCSADRWGATDLLSNATRIAHAEDEDPRAWVGAMCSGSPRQVLTLVHEAAHHWCFRSAVGNALLYLAGRTATNAYAMTALRSSTSTETSTDVADKDPTSAELDRLGDALRLVEDPRTSSEEGLSRQRLPLALHLQNDVIRRRAAIQLLRPLAEGLALFAEFDGATDHDTKVVSPLFACLSAAFPGSELQVRPLILMEFPNAMLRWARHSPRTVESKAGVLLRPTARDSGGYLTGYLTVKSLWRHLCTRDARLFKVTDLALMYLRSFFYEDLGLAAAILAEPSEDPMVSALAVEARLVERFGQLQEVTGDDIKAFEAWVLDPGRTSQAYPHTPGIRRTREEDRRDYEQLLRLIDLETTPPPGLHVFLPGAELAVDQVNRLLAVRGLLTVCSVPVTLRRLADGRFCVLFQDSTLYETEEAEAAPDAEGEGMLDIVVDMAGDGETYMGRTAVLSRADQILACTFWGATGEPADRHEVFRRQFATRESTRLGGQSLIRTANQTVDEHPKLRHNVAVAVRRLHGRADAIFGAMATWHASDPMAATSATEALERGGLRPLLGSVDLVRRAAALGLLTAGGRAVDTEDADGAGLDCTRTVEELTDAWSRHGFPPPPQVVKDSPDGPDFILPFL